MREFSRVVPAPANLGNEVLGVPPGADVALDLRLESVVEGVLVTGSARARTTGECVRCLDPLERQLEARFQELYVYPDVETPQGDDDEELRLEGDYLDLEQVLRDAVVLSLPFMPLCQDACAGLCPECGTRLADEPTHDHDATDPRWSALQGLLNDEPPEET